MKARERAYFDCVVHLGGHELACCYDDIFALLVGKVTVDIPSVLEEVGGVVLQELHLLQRLLKLLCLLDDLEHVTITLLLLKPNNKEAKQFAIIEK